MFFLIIFIGDFTIGETFVDEYISYADGSQAKVSIIYRGSTGNGILLYIASFPETPYVIAPGYCLIEKTTTAKYWTFIFGFGTAGDRIYRLQKNSNNQIKVWREE
jgi:hypothetical protein